MPNFKSWLLLPIVKQFFHSIKRDIDLEINRIELFVEFVCNEFLADKFAYCNICKTRNEVDKNGKVFFLFKDRLIHFVHVFQDADFWFTHSYKVMIFINNFQLNDHKIRIRILPPAGISATCMKYSSSYITFFIQWPHRSSPKVPVATTNLQLRLHYQICLEQIITLLFIFVFRFVILFQHLLIRGDFN